MNDPPSLPPALLRRIGEALYGEGWKNRLARDLDVAERTMRRWLSGDMAVPPGVTRQLYKMTCERQSDLSQVIYELYPSLGFSGEVSNEDPTQGSVREGRGSRGA